MLDIVILGYNIENQQNLMHFEQENDQKPHFGPFLALNGPFLGQHIFFSKIQKRHFSTPISGYQDAKNKKKLMAGNMRNRRRQIIKD